MKDTMLNFAADTSLEWYPVKAPVARAVPDVTLQIGINK
jgi:hypothetical protein